MREEELSQRQLERRALLRLRQGQAVEPDLDLDDVLGAVLLAVVELALLHGARCVGGIGMIFADSGAEQLHAAAGTGQLDDRRLHAGSLAELLGHRGGKGIHSRRSDDADLVAGFGLPGQQYAGGRKRKCAGECRSLHELSPVLVWGPKIEPAQAVARDCSLSALVSVDSVVRSSDAPSDDRSDPAREWPVPRSPASLPRLMSLLYDGWMTVR